MTKYSVELYIRYYKRRVCRAGTLTAARPMISLVMRIIAIKSVELMFARQSMHVWQHK